MALFKETMQNDGVTTNYHRIQDISITINHNCTVSVLSYMNNQLRAREIAGDMHPYQRLTMYEMPYEEVITVEKAYEYLKTLPDFEGAEDI